MRDLFARWATRATGATEPESASNDGTFRGAGDVAHDSAARATKATQTPAAGNAVAHVAQVHREGATTGKAREAKQDKAVSGVLPVLPVLPTTTSKPERNAQCLDADAGELVAVKLRGTIIGDVWLVADAETLAANPDLLRSGLAVFFFDEVQQLRGKTVQELKAIGMVKAEFPTSRVLQ
jgi:hypothetical protein